MRKSAASVIVPWILAAGGFAAAAGIWTRGGEPAPPPAVAPASEDPRELKKLRLSLAASAAESDALREELDRLLALHRGREAPAPSRQSAGAPKTVVDPVVPEELQRAVSDYRDALGRAAGGDEAADDEAYEAVMKLVRSGPAAFPLLRDAYLATSDPKVRAMMVRAFMPGQGVEAQEFLATQLRSEGDRAVREELLQRAAHMSSPATAPVFRDAFLDVLRGEGDVELKATAVRGLRHLRHDEDVSQALIAAASNPAEEVRVAALENLAFRPELRDRMREIVAAETDSKVREIGECRLLLAESPW